MNSKAETNKDFKAGYVALLGRPNVGKSTLLNALVGEKISIVTAKPHTTRNRIIGILSRPAGQAVFFDTPGFDPKSGRTLHRLMARSLRQTLEDADLVLLVTEANRPIDVDAALIREVTGAGRPTILVINKIDRLKQRDELLPRLDALRAFEFVELVPVSARSGTNLAVLETAIMRHLPEGPPLYPTEYRTDQSDSFRAAEIIREKLMEQLHQEVPYGIAVEIESMAPDEQGLLRIRAIVWIERESHKAIVIGKNGSVLKRIGRLARLELNQVFGRRLHLELWVKVREHWSDNLEELRRLGFDAQ